MNADNSSPASPTESQSDRDSGPGVGALLRASRLRCGEDLRAVAHLLRIRLSYLEAIEDGRFNDLPGSTYAIGFVRAYSEHLGLDSEEVIRRFKAETSETSGTTPRLEFPVPVPERGIPGGAVLFVGVVLAVIAYGGWYASTTKDSFLAELISPIPERLAALLPEEGTPPAVDAAGANKETDGPSSPTAATAATPAIEQPAPKDAGTEAEQSVAAEQPVADPPAEPAPVTAATDQPAILTPPPATNSPTPQSESVATGATTSSGPETPAQATGDQVAENAAGQVPPALPPSGQDSARDLTPASEATPPATENAGAAARDAAKAAAEAEKKVKLPSISTATSGESATVAPVTPTVTPPPAANDEKAKPAAETASADAGTSATTPPPAVENPQVAAVPPPAKPSIGDGSATASETSRAGQVFGAQDEISRILVRAKSNSWIQVRDDNGNQLLLTRLLRAGDSYRVPDRPGLTLLTGNAGALEILVDGETVPSIGPPGAVRRGVLLDINRLREGTAVTN